VTAPLTEATARSVCFLPLPHPSEKGAEELIATWNQVLCGPCAIVTDRRTIERMLAVPRAAPGVDVPHRGLLDRRVIPSRKQRARLGALGTALAGPDEPGFAVTHIVDLGGVYLPGQGTCVWVLFTGDAVVCPTVRVMRCDRGEPETPRRPEKGLVWSAIAAGFAWDTLGSTDWTTTVDVPRDDVAAVVEAMVPTATREARQRFTEETATRCPVDTAVELEGAGRG